jgi:hypothetical protein
MLVVLVVLAGCAGKRAVVGPSSPGGTNTAPAPPATVGVGECADPARDGIVGKTPRMDKADRDLDGDGKAELVRVDRSICTAEGNCYWNIFARSGGCPRYLGAIAAQRLERLPEQGDHGFHDVRGWWRFSGGKRVLMQQYRFRHGGYRVVDALLCRQGDDDRLVCAEDRPHDGT